MTIQNPNIANLAIVPIDGTAAAPSISFGGGASGNSGTGFYGTYGSIGASVDGTLMMAVDATGVTIAGALVAGSFATSVNGFSIGNNVYILSGATAPVDGTTGDNFAGPGSIYVARDTGTMYLQTSLITTPVWTVVESGNSVLGQPLTGFSAAAGTVAAADTILVAFNKLVGNTQNLTVIGNLLTAFSAGAGTVSAADSVLGALQKLTGNTQNLAVTANLLTGLAAGSATPISATDSILVALANLQAQIDAL